MIAVSEAVMIVNSARYRWDEATPAIIVIAMGLLVCVGAQILRAVQDGARRDLS